MIERTPNMESLLLSIQLVPWEGERQLEWIRRTGFAEDETSLQLEDFYHAVKNHVTRTEGEEFPTPLERGALELLGLFKELIDVAPDLWGPESMVSMDQRGMVRSKARRLLVEIGASSWSCFLSGPRPSRPFA